MSIMARPSQRKLAESQSLIATQYVTSVLNGKQPLARHAMLMQRIYNTTSAAASPEHYLYAESLRAYEKVLGSDTAAFLAAFNSVCERYKASSPKPTHLECGGQEREIILTALAKLGQAAGDLRGFYFPFLGAIDERRNTHLCTG